MYYGGHVKSIHNDYEILKPACYALKATLWQMGKCRMLKVNIDDPRLAAVIQIAGINKLPFSHFFVRSHEKIKIIGVFLSHGIFHENAPY